MSTDALSEAEAVVNLFSGRERRLAVAETCTGGLLAARITGVAGASDVLDRAVVPYAYDAHRTGLAVTRETIDDHGAVSAPVAAELAQRIRDLADTAWAVSTTGIAGPGGGTDDKPVGTAFAGVAHAAPWGSGESHATTRSWEFDGSRREIREQLVAGALSALLEEVRDRDKRSV